MYNVSWLSSRAFWDVLVLHLRYNTSQIWPSGKSLTPVRWRMSCGSSNITDSKWGRLQERNLKVLTPTPPFGSTLQTTLSTSQQQSTVLQILTCTAAKSSAGKKPFESGLWLLWWFAEMHKNHSERTMVWCVCVCGGGWIMKLTELADSVRPHWPMHSVTCITLRPGFPLRSGGQPGAASSSSQWC